MVKGLQDAGGDREGRRALVTADASNLHGKGAGLDAPQKGGRQD